MKTNNTKSSNTPRIRSFRDLQAERARVKAETKIIEQKIGNNYSNLLEALRPQNIFNSIVKEVATSSAWISGAYTIGKKLLKKRKKNKKVLDIDS